jgi:hypothetical protein
MEIYLLSVFVNAKGCLNLKPDRQTARFSKYAAQTMQRFQQI